MNPDFLSHDNIVEFRAGIVIMMNMWGSRVATLQMAEVLLTQFNGQISNNPCIYTFWDGWTRQRISVEDEKAMIHAIDPSIIKDENVK